MDRIQAGDLKSYLALQVPNTETEYVAPDDSSEARRIHDLRGLGEVIYDNQNDTDASEAFADGFGLEIKHGDSETSDRRFQSDGSIS